MHALCAARSLNHSNHFQSERADLQQTSLLVFPNTKAHCPCLTVETVSTRVFIPVATSRPPRLGGIDCNVSGLDTCHSGALEIVLVSVDVGENAGFRSGIRASTPLIKQ